MGLSLIVGLNGALKTGKEEEDFARVCLKSGKGKGGYRGGRNSQIYALMWGRVYPTYQISLFYQTHNEKSPYKMCVLL